MLGKLRRIGVVPRVEGYGMFVAVVVFEILGAGCFWECQAGIVCLAAVDVAADSTVARSQFDSQT